MPEQVRADVVRSLPDLIPRLRGMAGFDEVMQSLQGGRRATIDGAWGSSCALTAATLAQESPRPLLIVLPRIRDVDDFAADLVPLLDETPLVFPAWETLPEEHDVSDAIFGGRLRVLSQLDHLPQVIVTSLPALLQPVPARTEREQGTRLLKVGGDLDLDEFLHWLVERGFERSSAVEVPGEFAVHGGIVDVFPPDALDPIRIELFGDEIDSIRQFAIETQRTVERLPSVTLTVVAPVKSGDGKAISGGGHFLDELPSDGWIVLSEPSDLIHEGKQYVDRLRDARGLFSVDSTMARCLERPCVSVSAISEGREETYFRLNTESTERFTGPKSEVLDELASVIEQDERVLIACHNEGERERLSELLEQRKSPTPDGSLVERVQLCLGTVTQGYRLTGLGLIVLSDHELFSRQEVRRTTPRKSKVESRAIESFIDLNEGDLVVHLTHGIARYRGMEVLEREDRREENLLLEFRDKMRMYVPVSLIHLVQKYIGGAKSVPNLSKLGGTGWAAKKARVAAAVEDMASDMLKLQAERESKPGFACPPDSHWQHEFEAAFPYVETDDQLHAIADAKQDLGQTRPMDRLICGDVGFGKTEVAMRAAFKMIDSGRQVAVLVPTTVLAEQHYRTFRDRMAEYPFTIETLSRFRTKAEQRETLAGMEAGTVDLVIGTHRLVQQDVRFKDLGLLIIDEEQRFGVDAKEMLKRVRLTVDVLTMTATPIPRTLHLSLLGIRDISNLTTPPQDRVSIQTSSCRWDGELIRSAIIRELNRGGQCYFVHNRVYNIQSIVDRLQSIVPEATFAIVHGQMPESMIEENMLAFVSGKVDVLVATTIIESGLDIPNANTIFIHQADKYGLADLHQLRGRVGRYKNRAYCYLVLEEGKSITSAGAKRLKAIEEYSELGAGFKIAMRDLEIRGAGNILGAEQSGHIGAVGYELYCQLLENAVRNLKHLPPRKRPHVNVDLPIAALIPDEYVPPGRQKIDVYRKISASVNMAELHDVVAELKDRFGTPPPEVERLVSLRELQMLAYERGIEAIREEDGYTLFAYNDPQKIHNLAARIGPDLRIADRHNAYLVMHQSLEGSPLLEHLITVLR
ncbi:MAG: transcription-repair coupling factor [Planctomycetaceae bacterium]|nr:transcription-repair coupling factor [Planctomycetaceae bacterium]